MPRPSFPHLRIHNQQLSLPRKIVQRLSIHASHIRGTRDTIRRGLQPRPTFTVDKNCVPHILNSPPRRFHKTNGAGDVQLVARAAIAGHEIIMTENRLAVKPLRLFAFQL
jgi:hypothetical protein